MGQAKRRGTFEERLAKAPKIRMSERELYNRASCMIHENKYEVTDCYVCGKEMETIHDTHNAFPLAKLQSAKEAYESGESFRCCTECDEKVLEERLKFTNTKKDECSYISIDESIEREKTRPLKSIFMTPQAQKRFEELGQNFFETDLGKSFKERNLH